MRALRATALLFCRPTTTRFLRAPVAPSPVWRSCTCMTISCRLLRWTQMANALTKVRSCVMRLHCTRAEPLFLLCAAVQFRA